MKEKLLDIYKRLLSAWGPQNWWPADTPFEVMVGAILTQGVSWTNVEKAMDNLARAGVLDPISIATLPEEELAQLVRPSGYYRVKARKLKSFMAFLLSQPQGDLENLFALPLEEIRPLLLQVWGIGPETADSILLYAGRYPIFVVDAYTQRSTARLGLAEEGADYEKLQSLFMDNLPRQEDLFNEYHALLVCLGKHHCKKNNPRCGDCPLVDLCPWGSQE